MMITHDPPLVTNLRTIGLYDVVARHAREHHVTVAAMCSPRKTVSLHAARRAAWAELRATTKLSLTELGRLFGRHYSTVIHALKPISTCAQVVVSRESGEVIEVA